LILLGAQGQYERKGAKESLTGVIKEGTKSPPLACPVPDRGGETIISPLNGRKLQTYRMRKDPTWGGF